MARRVSAADRAAGQPSLDPFGAQRLVGPVPHEQPDERRPDDERRASGSDLAVRPSAMGDERRGTTASPRPVHAAATVPVFGLPDTFQTAARGQLGRRRAAARAAG